MTKTKQSRHSPIPWGYEYNPFTVRPTSDGPEIEIPAFEVFDNDGNKVFDTNEDTPSDQQETNAQLAVLASEMLETLQAFLDADIRAKECAEWKWENLDHAFARAQAVVAKVA
jgi:hypothetical protein